MAAITLNECVDTLDLDRFATFVEHELPLYAVPVFLRIQPDIDVTGTFKMVKGDLREQAYDTNAFDDPVYVMRSGEKIYQPLDQQLLAAINDGAAGF